ncbi:MAG: ABC transporter ATP-binding protein [Eubacteriales bacterium]|nr:ABC transporter ATP-binding protein [Eubacteriales bacterium]
MLEVNGLFVDIKGQPILKGVDFSVKSGELMGLLGPSGCGKSTLLKAVAGILPPKSGSILIGGENMANVPPHKRGAVIVFQDMRLFPNMTALENVAFPIKMRGVPKRQRLEQAEQLMKSVQLCGLERRRINELSGGQQQRVALARALAAQPRLLLLDEPFTALDNELKEEIRALVLELHKKFRTTTVLVTHDRQEAFAMADRIAVMRDGRVMRQGARDEMAEHLGNKEGEA